MIFNVLAVNVGKRGREPTTSRVPQSGERRAKGVRGTDYVASYQREIPGSDVIGEYRGAPQPDVIPYSTVPRPLLRFPVVADEPDVRRAEPANLSVLHPEILSRGSV